jgi:hypothetical protein
MTNAEKIAAMAQRNPNVAHLDHDEGYFSFMVIMGYMDFLVSNNLIPMIEWEISETGKDFLALCQEFDWQPTIEHIGDFVSEFVPDENKFAVAKLLVVMSKDAEGFKNTVLKMKKVQ